MTKQIEPVEPILRRDLLTLATAYARATKTAVTLPGRKGRPRSTDDLRYVSRLVGGDSLFFGKLDALGGSFTARRYDEIVAWFTANWPADSKMPVISTTIPPQQKGRANGSKTSPIRNRQKEGRRHKATGRQ